MANWNRDQTKQVAESGLESTASGSVEVHGRVGARMHRAQLTVHPYTAPPKIRAHEPASVSAVSTTIVKS